ncbi:hypothetical protein LXA43DRAFT_897672 [Ganoderma leucocontextum]|nr:hypothetical protein LXA43DRAFT_897672 [Ganoderma leucocontextum]
MARLCGICVRSFPTARGLSQHRSHYHRRPKPPPPRSIFRRHPHLRGDPCGADGNPLPGNQPPPPPPPPPVEDWAPFSNGPTFEFAEHTFEKVENSIGEVNELLRILAARDTLHGHHDTPPIFRTTQDYFATIDVIPYGELGWDSVAFRYTGPVHANSPSWKHKSYVVHLRNSLHAVEGMLASPDFRNKFDVAPYEEFITLPNGNKTRRFSNLMSGQWANRKAVQAHPELIGSMLVTVMCGADKTTVSTGTGNQEFHPMYLGVGNIHNDMRRAHREAVIPIAFLAIPKGEREDEDSEEFRIFKKQLYHQALAYVLSPLRPGMLAPHVLKCPDGIHRRAIFQLGPFIADYPEQVYLSGIVQGWCPKCMARPEELATAGDPRFRELHERLRDTYSSADLWDSFGIVNDVTVFTEYFPRADIHELLTPDLLHQLIKGTFKDHLVSWVEDYIHATAPSEAEAKRIVDDIDRRLAASPVFPGLRRFPNGRNFSQWTGNDSKALMKVFIPAIVGYVPDEMVRCLSVFMDFCYLARRSAHTTEDLADMTTTLHRFHQLRVIFEEAGVRPNGFSLPRQHALVHYVRAIQMFGSLNGLCSSITESRHITAVKRPWRRSSRKEPLGQMLRTITRLSKLAAIRVEFARRKMLRRDVSQHSQRLVHILYEAPDQGRREEEPYTRRLNTIADDLGEPRLTQYLRQYLHDRLFPEYELAVDIPLDNCPPLSPDARIAAYHSARAVFYAPSEAAGSTGMHQEFIRCTPKWYGKHPRYDTVLVQTDPDAPGMAGMGVARVRAFLSFVYEYTRHECALVEWFEVDGDGPDPVTGMWIVKPEKNGNQRVKSVISIRQIVRACHLIGVYGRSRVPVGFQHMDSLDAFRRFYLNWFADYHAHETIV